MAQTGVAAWSKTAGNNATADSDVSWPEGMAPAQVNDSSRAEMASVAKWRDDFGGSLVAGGTSTAYTLTTNQTFSTLGFLDGQRLSFSVNTTNGASATLNVDSLGAKALQLNSTVAVAASTFKPGARYDVSYNSSGGYFLVYGLPNQLGDVTFNAITASSVSSGSFLGSTVTATTVSTSGAIVGSQLTVGGLLTASGGIAGITAAQSDMEAASSTTLYVSPGRQHFHPGSAKAWAKFTFSGAISSSYGVSSLTDGAIGIQTVNWATAFSSASYAVFLTPILDNVVIMRVRHAGSTNQATTACEVVNTDAAGSGADVVALIGAFGDQ